MLKIFPIKKKPMNINKILFIPQEKRKTIYMCCCWSGARRVKDQRYQKDPTFYLNEHINNLNKYKHNLDHIVFAISKNVTEPASYTDYVNKIPKKIQNATVEVLRRENVGMSYGALSDVYLKHKDNYKYYFTIEDDYSAVQNNFDLIFINKLESDPKIGYVCPLAGKVYADISVGCIKSEALEKIAKINGEVLYPIPKNGTKRHRSYDAVYFHGQFNFGVWMRKAGYDIVDLREQFHCGFRDPKPFPNNIRWFYTENADPIVLPI